MMFPARGRIAGATIHRYCKSFTGRARYDLSAFSLLEPELPGSVNNEPGPQLDCAATKFLTRPLRQPSLWHVCGTSLLAKDSAGVSGAAPCRLRASDVAD